MGEVLDDVVRVLGYVLTGARRYTDRFEMLRRRRELGLAAEIQWELLPSLAFELPAFSIAGTVEPAYEIGGDNFDYAISAHRLTVSVSDAVGHGIRAALLASLAVTAMRNARRAHCTIVEQAGAANRHLVEQFPGADFVTGLILELDVDNGTGMILNAGHPPPLLLRDGGVSELLVPPELPLGLVGSAHYRLHPIQLHPGDRLLLFTDGITEAHRRGEREFGYRRLAACSRTVTSSSPPNSSGTSPARSTSPATVNSATTPPRSASTGIPPQRSGATYSPAGRAAPNVVGRACNHNGSGTEEVVPTGSAEQDPLSQQGEAGASVHLPLQELELGVGALDRAVAVGQAQPGEAVLKGKTLLDADAALAVTRSLPHGHVALVAPQPRVVKRATPSTPRTPPAAASAHPATPTTITIDIHGASP